MANTKTKTKPATKKPVAKKTATRKPAATKRVAPIVSAPTAPSRPKMVGFRAAIRTFFAKYFDFNGAATRAEYWWVILLLSVVVLCGTGLLPALALWFGSAVFAYISMILMWLVALFIIAVIIPSAALMSRRVHDAGFSAWLFFAPWIAVNLIQAVSGFYGYSFMIVSWLGYAVSLLGLVLTLLPSRLDNNPYRD